MASVGTISLDLSVNNKKFNKQIDNIGKQAKSSMGKLDIAMGNIIANLATKAIAGIGRFVSDSIKKGSDLQELDNIVESVFTNMTKQVENFADTALEKYGLTEAQSKKMVGTFGAMSKAFGYTEEQAFAMSTALTGLAGDVASFYNLSHDEAYTKLKSVFTGETESLKELGVVMTQSALDQFALAQGLGHTTSAMSEQEKVALRLAFVQDKLAVASGDFEKTSGNWANQTRILAGQFESLKAAIGQGLISALTPVIQVINTIMGKLVALANTFRNFMQMIFGGGGGSSGASGAMQGMADAAANAADSTQGVADAAGGAAGSAAKAKKSLMGFDELNKIQGDAGGGGGGGGGASGFDFGSFETGTTAVEQSIDSANEKLKALLETFKNGFKDGLGDDFENSLKRIKQHIVNIKTSLKGIFSDPEVQNAATKWANSVVYMLGQVLGSIVSIATTIAEFFVGSIDTYLQQNSGFIKERIVGIFDVGAELATKIGEFWDVIAEIFEVFRSPEAKQIGADLIGILANTALSATQLTLQLGADILNCITQPLTDNKDLIKETLINLFAPISTITTTIREGLTNTFTEIFKVYDAHIKPMFQSFANGLSKIATTLLTLWNTYIAPVLQNIANKFKEVFESKIQPMLNKFIGLFGKVADLISALWTNVLVPFINWLATTVIPVVAPIIESIATTVLEVIGNIATAIGGLIDIIGGIIDFITGVFTGDWEKCWQGIEGIFQGACGVLEGLVSGLINIIAGILKAAINILSGIVQLIWNAIKGIFTAGINVVKNLVTLAWNFIAGVFTNSGEIIKSITTTIWNTIKGIISTALNAIKSVISTIWDAIKNYISTVLNTIKTIVTTLFEAIKTTTTSKWNAIKSVVSTVINSMKSFVSNGLGNIKTTFTNVFTQIKTTLSSILNGIKSAVTGTVNSIKSAVKGMANGVITALNSMINSLNKLNITVPDWVPGIGGKKFSLNIPKLPMLAQGGYVRANQPQPVIVGDNKTQGEIISPEGKMLEITMLALEKFFGKLMAAGYNSGNKDDQVGDIVIPIYLDGTLLDEVIVTAQQRRNMRSGGRGYAVG